MTRAAVSAALMVLASHSAGAQRLQPEARFETIGAAYHGLVSVAVHVPVGRYGRVGVGGVGVATRRADVLARFTFDPFRQMRWALSAGAGLSYDSELRELYLALHSDLEGPSLGRVTPFVSAGVAGGARFAVGVRRAFRNRR